MFPFKDFPVLKSCPTGSPVHCAGRGYWKHSDKDSWIEDDDMSEEEGGTLASNTRDKSQNSNMQGLEFIMGEHVLPKYLESS